MTEITIIVPDWAVITIIVILIFWTAAIMVDIIFTILKWAADFTPPTDERLNPPQE